jgi:spore coat protein CotH
LHQAWVFVFTGAAAASPRLGQDSGSIFGGNTGPRELPPGVLFSAAAQPVRRIVVHDDVRREGKVDWHFANPLAYDIARAIGAIAPETKPVRFFLNGEYYGPFVVTERFDERFFAAHWGYDDILLSQEEMNKLWEWVRTTRPLTMANVSQHVNIDNVTRWFLAVAFTATRDAYQGPGQFLDRTRRPAPGSGSIGTWTRVFAIGTSTVTSTCSNASQKAGEAATPRSRGR